MSAGSSQVKTMSNPTYEARQKNKKLKAQARQAAARLHGLTEVQHFGEVNLMLGGAFVEVKVWVPLDEIVKEAVA